jgi:HK97 family phage portal protein
MANPLTALVRAQDTKAVPSHPFLLTRDPVIVRGDQRGPKRVSFQKPEAGRHLQAYGGQRDAIDWVMACVRLIAETTSDAEWYFEREGVKLINRKGPQAPFGVESAPLRAVELFEKPNPYMAWAEHIELTLIDYLVTGDAYWWQFGLNASMQPAALYRLSPQYMKIVPGTMGPEGYEFQMPGMEKPLQLSPKEVVHFRQANPHSLYHGMGIVQGGSRPLDLELALTDTQATYFEKGAHPSIILQSDRRVPDNVFRKTKLLFKNLYGGSRNAGEPMLLEAGIKALPISPDANQAMFEALTKLSRDRILAMFRVPPPLLGITEGASDTKTNEAQRVFDTKTMRPLLDKLQLAISDRVTRPAFGLDFIIDYNYVMPVEERIKLVSNFASVPGVKLREIREMAGLQPLGDERDEWVLNLPGEDGTEEDHDGGLPDRNLTGEPGRPPNPENTERFPNPGEGGPPPKAEVSTRGRKALTAEEVAARIEAKAIILQRRDEQRPLPDVIPPDTQRDERESEIDLIVADFKAELADAAYPLERALLDHAEGKAAGDTIYQRIKNSPAWAQFRETVEDSMRRALTRAASLSAQQAARLGFAPEGEIDYDEIVEAIIGRDDGGDEVVRTLRGEIAQKVLRIQRKGGSRDDVEQAVRESVDFWRASKAETIALTEATHAYNETTLTVAEAAGATHVGVHDGDDHDQPCIDANGSKWTIHEARERRIEHPRCRRYFVPIPAVA